MSASFTRVQQGAPDEARLLSPQRDAIVRIVRQAPGLPLDAVRAHVGMSWGSLYYHIDLLMEAGLLQIVADGRRRLLMPGTRSLPPSLSTQDEATVVSLNGARGTCARRIAKLLAAEPGLSVEFLARRLDLPRSSVYYNVRRLLEAGMIERGAVYGSLCPTRLLTATLQEMEETEPEEAAKHRVSQL